MSFCAYDSQASGLTHFRGELDVSSPSCHVGCYCYCTCLSGFCHYFSLTLVELGIQNVMLQAFHLEHTAKQFRYLNGGCTNEHRPPLLIEIYYLVNNCIVFFPL